MQYKKEELKAFILENAEREFLKKGYQNASLRTIAKNSGTTIGNLYHYFENKEALFGELVGREYEMFLYLLNHHTDMSIPSDITETSDIRVWRAFLLKWLESMMPAYTNRFYILLEKSAGSSYQDTKHRFVELMAEHFNEHMDQRQITVTPGLANVIAEQLICGVLYVIAHYEDAIQRRELICDTLIFCVAGMIKLFEQQG